MRLSSQLCPEIKARPKVMAQINRIKLIAVWVQMKLGLRKKKILSLEIMIVFKTN